MPNSNKYITENTIDMTEFFYSLPAMEDKRLVNIYNKCINDKLIAAGNDYGLFWRALKDSNLRPTV